MKVAKRLEGINEYYFSQKLREIDELNRSGEAVINLGIGSPDTAPHSEVTQALQEECIRHDVHAYQNYRGVPELRNAIAEWYQRWYSVHLNPDTEILPLMGSKEGIVHICMTYLSEGDAALVPNPGYPTYRSAVGLAGGIAMEYSLKGENNWLPDFEALEKQDLSKVKLMWVNYPHMPTGQLPTESLFEQIVAFGKRHNILICHDNPYSFILNDHPMSLLEVSGAKDIVIELNSMSKSHNMAGWRIGMLCGTADRIAEVLRFKSNMDSGMFLPLQLAAIKGLALDEEWHHALNTMYARRRDKIFQLLGILNCKYDQKQGGLFVWAKVPGQYKDGFDLSDKVLATSRVFITPGGIFGTEGNNYIRVSLCGNEEKITEAITRIKMNFV